MHWRFACQSCGTSFKENVNTCLECGSENVVPIERVENTEVDDQ